MQLSNNNIESAIERQQAAAKAMLEAFGGKAPEALFDYILATVESNAVMAFAAAKGLSVFSCEARDIARQRRMNQMVEIGIIMIEEMFNTTVACSRSEEVNAVPYPPQISRTQTLLNFRNKR